MTYTPPPFPFITAKKKDGKTRESTLIGQALMGAMHHAYKAQVPDDVLKDLWLNGMEAYRMACLIDAFEGTASRVGMGVNWEQAARSFHGLVIQKALSRTERFLMIAEAMLPPEKS